MGLKRITAVIEVTYAADDDRTWDQLIVATQDGMERGLPSNAGQLAACSVIRTSVDPDAEPSLPEPEPADQSGLTKP